ncbi:hypothetical protein [Adhaeribacter aquaticus]|uniref:hypothetical protein n=1 Tax=Adhaeribacter aquaticus TaxID=299567 RepID=UPI0004049AAC|nr:hypothetical protein [Adhaeribacter aquaticus]
MPKKYLFYLLGIVLLAVAGIYGYTKWTEAKEKVNLWTLVPEDAVFVVESQNHSQLLRKIQTSDIWDNLSTVRSIEALTENIAILDSLSGRNEGASRFLKRKTLLTSVHVVNKENFDFVFYIPVNTVGEHRFVRALVENIGKNEAFKEQVLSYQNHQITSIVNQQNNDSFYYFSYHNNLIISANLDLIKEIIRKIDRGQLESPAVDYKNINYLAQPDVFAHIFINYQQLPAFFNIFFKNEIQPDISFLSSLCRNSMLELKDQRGKLFLNGFSNPEILSDSFYNQVKNQSPQPFSLQGLMPSRTAMLLYFGLDKVTKIRHFNSKDNESGNKPILTDSLANSFAKEVAIAYVAGVKTNAKTEKIIFARASDTRKTGALLNQLIKETGAPIHPESYAGFTLKALPIPDLPFLLFGSLASGFEQCYVAQVGDYYLFAPNAPALRGVLSDIKTENVWNKDEAQKGFLEQTQQETNFSLYFNAALAWNLLKEQVEENQRASLLRHESIIRKFDQVAWQFAQKENQYYTTLIVARPENDQVAKASLATFEVRNQVLFKSKLLTGPLEPQTEAATSLPVILVQDSAFTMHQINSAGEIAWSDSLYEPLVSPVYQLLFKDNRPRFLFATQTQVHCIDANGSEAENFPFHLPDSVQIQNLSVFNFNQTADFQFLIGDQQGNLYMFDNVGNTPPGWESKHLETALAANPQHFKINGRNVIITLQKNGYIYAFNSKGEVYPGFPITINAPLASSGFINVGNSFRKSQFTVVTQNGKLVTFNLTGELLSNKSIGALNSRQNFELVPDAKGKSFVIARHMGAKVSIYDQQGSKLLLEKNFVTSSRKEVQYFDFGPLNKIYALTETGPRKTYLHNYKAKLIGQQPVDNDQKVVVRFNAISNLYYLFTAPGREVRQFTFRTE